MSDDLYEAERHLRGFSDKGHPMTTAQQRLELLELEALATPGPWTPLPFASRNAIRAIIEEYHEAIAAIADEHDDPNHYDQPCQCIFCAQHRAVLELQSAKAKP